jgi:hypothetical protein
LQATKHITSKGKATRTALALSVNFSRTNMESNLKSPHGKIVGILLDNGGVAAFDFVEQEGGSIYKLNGEFESSPKADVSGNFILVDATGTKWAAGDVELYTFTGMSGARPYEN